MQVIHVTYNGYIDMHIMDATALGGECVWPPFIYYIMQ